MSEPADPIPQPDPAAALQHIVDDTPLDYESAVPAADDAPGRLNIARIQRMATLRRATMRQRSWHLIAATVSALAAIELVRRAILAAHHPIAYWSVGFALAAVASAALTIVFLDGAIRLARELRRAASTPSAAQAPIDFTPLSDGRQLAENLAAMQPQISEPEEEIR